MQKTNLNACNSNKIPVNIIALIFRLSLFLLREPLLSQTIRLISLLYYALPYPYSFVQGIGCNQIIHIRTTACQLLPAGFLSSKRLWGFGMLQIFPCQAAAILFRFLSCSALLHKKDKSHRPPFLKFLL